jgi:hypothetical protein
MSDKKLQAGMSYNDLSKGAADRKVPNYMGDARHKGDMVHWSKLSPSQRSQANQMFVHQTPVSSHVGHNKPIANDKYHYQLDHKGNVSGRRHLTNIGHHEGKLENLKAMPAPKLTKGMSYSSLRKSEESRVSSGGTGREEEITSPGGGPINKNSQAVEAKTNPRPGAPIPTLNNDLDKAKIMSFPTGKVLADLPTDQSKVGQGKANVSPMTGAIVPSSIQRQVMARVSGEQHPLHPIVEAEKKARMSPHGDANEPAFPSEPKMKKGQSYNDLKGVHTSGGFTGLENKGQSQAGRNIERAREPQPNSHLANMYHERGKAMHEDKLKELKAMPKPKLSKGKSYAELKRDEDDASNSPNMSPGNEDAGG